MRRVGQTEITAVQGDITQQKVDIIVNAANSALAIGGGVDGAIHRAGGPAIHAETRERYPDGCPTGSAVISGAGNLPAKWVIHAVGPIWHGGNDGEAEQLGGAYRRSLELASEAGAESIAFPAISTGVYGYPPEAAAKIAISTVQHFLKANSQTPLREVRFVMYGESAMKLIAGMLSDEIK